MILRPLAIFSEFNKLFLLNHVYGTLIIPFEVLNELKNLSKFGFDATEIFSQPWIEIKETFSTHKFYSKKGNVHLGKTAAISLALELHAHYILIDDRMGQLVALRQNLHPIGTLGTLKLAKEKGIITLAKDILDEIIASSNYWLSKKVYSEFLQSCNEYRTSSLL